MKEDIWDTNIVMIYERIYKCYTYRYIIRKNKKTIYSKDHFKYDEERIEKILKKLQKEDSEGLNI